jgi:hypothetical protein
MDGSVRMEPRHYLFAAGLLLMAVAFFAFLGRYCPSCSAERDVAAWMAWTGVFGAGAALVVAGLFWGSKKP